MDKLHTPKTSLREDRAPICSKRTCVNFSDMKLCFFLSLTRDRDNNVHSGEVHGVGRSSHVCTGVDQRRNDSLPQGLHLGQSHWLPLHPGGTKMITDDFKINQQEANMQTHTHILASLAQLEQKTRGTDFSKTEPSFSKVEMQGGGCPGLYILGLLAHTSPALLSH